MATTSSYLDELLRGQGQRKVTGQEAFTPGQIQAAYTADLAARYSDDTARTKAAFSEAATTRGLDLQESSLNLSADAQKKQQEAGQLQTGVSAVGAVGTLGLGYSAASKAGLFGAPAATTTTGATPAVVGTGVGSSTALAAEGAAAGVTGAYAAYAAGASTGALTNIGGGIALTEAGAAVNIGAATTAGVGAYAAGSAATVGSIEAASSISYGVGEMIVAIAAAAAWVLCSELVRQGKLDQSIVDDEWSYIREVITDDEYHGYRIIADPLVKLMQKSKMFTSFMCPLIRGFAYEMASRVNPEVKGSRLGKFILWWGMPLCRVASRIKREDEQWLSQHIA